MIVPLIHRLLRRDDLARLIAAIGRIDTEAASRGSRALDRGAIDDILDSPQALDAVCGNGGTPAPLPLTLLWYVPVRASLREQGELDIPLADYAATLPVVFASARQLFAAGRQDSGLVPWTRSVTSLPRGTVIRAERAAFVASVALWWAGCFPERVRHLGGSGMVRAYVDFAAWALEDAAASLHRRSPDTARVYGHAARRTRLVRDALGECRAHYLAPHAHSASNRLERFLERLRLGPAA